LNPMDSLKYLKAEIAKCKQSVESLQTETSSLNTLYEKAALSQCTNLTIPTPTPLASGYSKPFYQPNQENTSILPTYRSQKENLQQINFAGLQSDGFTRRTDGFTRRTISPTICQTRRQLELQTPIAKPPSSRTHRRLGSDIANLELSKLKLNNDYMSSEN
jgi:hypothetical protein